MPPPQPSIIALGSKHEKGRALERAVGAVWSQLGYRKMKYNVHATGEEIDLEGSHVVTEEVLKGQCKAHSKAIDSVAVRLFYADVEKQHKKNNHLTGVMVSLSGFNGTAIRWHEELNADQKSYFKLTDGPGFVQHLVEAGLIINAEALISGLKTKLTVSRLSLLLTERGLFWMATLADAQSETAYYTLLTDSGDTPRQNDIEYLQTRLRSLPKGVVQISLIDRSAVIRSLLKFPDRRIEDMVTATPHPREDIEAAIASIASERLLTEAAGFFELRLELDSFLTIANFCVGTALETDFMLSHFYKEAREKLLIPYISGKYLVPLSPEEADILKKILALSPTALARVTQGDAESFRNTDQHIKDLHLPEKQVEEIRQLSKRQLLDLLPMISSTIGTRRTSRP